MVKLDNIHLFVCLPLCLPFRQIDQLINWLIGINIDIDQSVYGSKGNLDQRMG